jgi:site-specific DNA-methyltransferase (adenine-specific)
VRSYLRLNTPTLFSRESRGVYRLSEVPSADIGVDTGEGQSFESCRFGNAEIIFADCFDWLAAREDCSIHAIVTDPPYGLHEYTREQQDKLRTGKGGVWRIPPSFDGHRRSPLPRFTTLTDEQISHLGRFFYRWARLLAPKLVPGANVLVASNPLVSHIVSSSLAEAGLERRGEIIRLVMTMRGGDRPKTAHEEFPEVSVMPRSMWEPWLVFRRPLEGTARDNLRQWGTGGFRRPAAGKPFGDVIKSAPTQPNERRLAPHPSLKPQAFLRQIVRASLPLGRGVVVDPFAGAGSTLAAAECVGYPSIGVENDEHYFRMACRSIPALARFRVRAGS